MSKHRFLFFLFLVSMFNLTSCQQDATPYYEDFQNYLKKTHNKVIDEASKDQVYYLISLEGCYPCVDAHLNALIDLPPLKGLTVVSIGAAQSKEHGDALIHIAKKQNVLFDVEKKANGYELSLGKPLFIKIRNGKCLQYSEIRDPQIQSIHSSLINFLQDENPTI